MIHRFQQRNRVLPKQKQRDCPHIICNGGVQAYRWRLLVTEIDGCGRMIKKQGRASRSPTRAFGVSHYVVSDIAGVFLWRKCPYGHCLAVCSDRTADRSVCIER